MPTPTPPEASVDNEHILKQRAFLLLLIIVSILFMLLMRPFFSPVFWACILALSFQPVYQHFHSLYGGRPNLAALTTLAIGVILIILPALILLNVLIGETAELYARVEAGEFKPGEWLDRFYSTFPSLQGLLTRLDIDLVRIRTEFADAAVSITSFVGENALALGQGTLSWLVSFSIMLYVAFFMLRDGQQLSRLLARALPLGKRQQRLLFTKFTEVCRATLKGNVVVAIIQGSLGGLIFWVLGIPGALLWGVVMILLSLIPLVGSFLIWGPGAVYLMATGEMTKGVILLLYGAIIISLVDNLLRPMLVGRDTKLPDYMVLLSTLGGFALFGLIGFVLGPLIAALFMSLWGLFMEEYNQNDDPVPGLGMVKPEPDK